MTVGHLLLALRRFWWAVAAAGVLAGAAAWWLGGPPERLWSVEAAYVLGPAEHLERNRDAVDVAEALDRRTIVATFAELATSGRIRSRVVATLGAGPLTGTGIDARVEPGANVVTVEVTGPDPDPLPRIVEAVGAAATAEFERLYGVYRVEPLVEATEPRRRPDDRPVVAAAVGLIAAGVTGLLATWVDRWDRRRRRSALAVLDERPADPGQAPVRWVLPRSPVGPGVPGNGQAPAGDGTPVAVGGGPAGIQGAPDAAGFLDRLGRDRLAWIAEVLSEEERRRLEELAGEFTVRVRIAAAVRTRDADALRAVIGT